MPLQTTLRSSAGLGTASPWAGEMENKEREETEYKRERGNVKGGMEGNRRVTKAGWEFVGATMSALPENVIDSRQSPPLR